MKSKVILNSGRPGLPSAYLLILLFAVSILFIGANTITGNGDHKKNNGKIQIDLLQINDVYEISPLNHGRSGGMAKVATIRKELLAENKNTYTLVSGDFLSPSGIGTLVYDTITKKKIAGMQMVETFNTAGVDLVTFGNHEFDLKPVQLADAINFSTFDWVSSNVKENKTNAPINKMQDGKSVPIPATKIVSFTDDDGTKLKIGFFAITIKTAHPDPLTQFEIYEDYQLATRKAISDLKGNCDIIVAITHLDLNSDKMLAEKNPEIDLIIGGHEHVNSYDKVGKTIIAKADANAKTVFIHTLNYNTKTKQCDIKSRLLAVTNSIPDDEETSKVINKWNSMAYSTLSTKLKSDPCAIIDSLATALDGTEASVRTQPTNLGILICEALEEAVSNPVDLGITNSGGIRLDDILSGYITQYDLFRVLPFGGEIIIKEMKGSVLDTLVKNNYKRENKGSFLQFSGITQLGDDVYLNFKPLYMDSIYTVVMNDYLANGLQEGLESMKDLKTIPTQLKISENNIQKAFIEKMKSNALKNRSFEKNNMVIPCY